MEQKYILKNSAIYNVAIYIDCEWHWIIWLASCEWWLHHIVYGEGGRWRAGPGQVTAASHHNWHYTDTPATAFLATRAGQHLDTPPPDSGPMMRARASGDACCSVMVLGVGRKPPSGEERMWGGGIVLLLLPGVIPLVVSAHSTSKV